MLGCFLDTDTCIAGIVMRFRHTQGYKEYNKLSFHHNTPTISDNILTRYIINVKCHNSIGQWKMNVGQTALYQVETINLDEDEKLCWTSLLTVIASRNRKKVAGVNKILTSNRVWKRVSGVQLDGN